MKNGTPGVLPTLGPLVSISEWARRFLGVNGSSRVIQADSRRSSCVWLQGIVRRYRATGPKKELGT
jgi:hypothetical protein